MKLTIVIPALNEEEAIANTIDQCKAAAAEIILHSMITDVQIIVVSDGSTDRTVEITKHYSDIKLIVFEKNRGYGAAIKTGWKLGKGDFILVFGFILVVPVNSTFRKVVVGGEGVSS